MKWIQINETAYINSDKVILIRLRDEDIELELTDGRIITVTDDTLYEDIAYLVGLANQDD